MQRALPLDRDPAVALRAGDALRGRSPGPAVLADLARAGVASLGDLAAANCWMRMN